MISDHVSDFLFPTLLQVISPLLIVYRVAKGRAMTTTLQPSEQEMAQIPFNDAPSSHSSQNGEVRYNLSFILTIFHHFPKTHYHYLKQRITFHSHCINLS